MRFVILRASGDQLGEVGDHRDTGREDSDAEGDAHQPRPVGRVAGPDEASLAAAVADERVEVTEQDGTWTLRPADRAATTGIVFYPGARVEPAAYVPNWVPIVAESGVEVVILRMPLNLAVFDRSRGDGLQLARGHRRRAVGGGDPVGVLPDGRRGAGRADGPRVLSVGGTRDGLSTPDDLRARRALLPPDAELVFVEGMNHAQFGRYGGPAWRPHADDR